MIINNQKIIIKWGTKNKRYYESKGYTFTNYGDEFKIDAEDLPETSAKVVKVACDACGNIYTMKYNRYINSTKTYNGNYCLHCSKIHTLNDRQKKHYDRIVNFCSENGYTLCTPKDKITSVQSAVEYICPIHGIYRTKVISILSGKKCYQCSRDTTSRKLKEHINHEKISNLILRIKHICAENNYTLITPESDITRYNGYITYNCEKHGLHTVKIGNLLNGKRCPKCRLEESNLRNKMSIDDVIQRINSAGGTLLNPSDYKNTVLKNLKITCPNCGKPFITSFRSFTQHNGQLCSDCFKKESIGEVKIKKYLMNSHINFEQEKRFDDCRDANPLPFDFYLPQYNCAIEFDGEQHYNPTNFFSYSFQKNKLHDQIKTDYCNKNGICLIRIPYWDINNINNILDTKLNSHEDIV